MKICRICKIISDLFFKLTARGLNVNSAHFLGGGQHQAAAACFRCGEKLEPESERIEKRGGDSQTEELMTRRGDSLVAPPKQHIPGPVLRHLHINDFLLITAAQHRRHAQTHGTHGSGLKPTPAVAFLSFQAHAAH